MSNEYSFPISLFVKKRERNIMDDVYNSSHIFRCIFLMVHCTIELDQQTIKNKQPKFTECTILLFFVLFFESRSFAIILSIFPFEHLVSNLLWILRLWSHKSLTPNDYFSQTLNWCQNTIKCKGDTCKSYRWNLKRKCMFLV